MERYGRKYKLIIGHSPELVVANIPKTIIKPTLGATEEKSSYKDWSQIPSRKIEIESQRIQAEVGSTKGSVNNDTPTVIRLFNLKSKTKAFIKPDSVVILEAGYVQDQDLKTIFTGQVVKVSTTPQGVDSITTLECSQTATPRRNIRVSKFPLFDEDSEQIAKYFAEVAADNGIPTGNVFVPVKIPYPSGYPAAGGLFNILEDFCSYNNLKYYITLGKLYIEPLDYLPAIGKALITPDDVKGTVRENIDSSGTSSSTTTPSDVLVTCFLDGRFINTKLASITYGEYEGDYEIVSTLFNLDSEGDKWDVELELKRIA